MSSVVAISSIPTVAQQLGRSTPALLSLISVYQGDITRLAADAIVNAAAPDLLGGGGVDGAIHQAAGPQLLAACRPLHGCATGDAKITPGFNLPAQHVIHTVGPIDEHPELLASCYTRSLDLARQYGARTVAFPCVSTGVFGYPQEPACRVVLPTVRQWVEENPGALDRVVFCVFNRASKEIYDRVVGGM